MTPSVSVSDTTGNPLPSTIVVKLDYSARWSHRMQRLLTWLLIPSVVLNVWLLTNPLAYSRPEIPEQFVDGQRGAAQRIAIISVEGMISPPFTERWIRQLQQATKDDSVKGVVLAIDSPGGFVADSHQLHREIQKLSAKKPVYVSMKRLAASGGYYIAVAPGNKSRIFAEPTTWTGSIGVIIARYNATELAQKIGVTVEPLVTGPLKDTLNPFRDMTPEEKQVWDAILKDSFDRFVSVIEAGRPDLTDAAIRTLATGQIYTATQALANHLVDEIGYQEDAVKALATSLGLSSWETFEYRSTPGLVDALLGAQVRTPTITEQFFEAAVPKAMYLASWNPLVPAP